MALVGLKQDRVEGAEIERFFFYSGGGFVFCGFV